MRRKLRELLEGDPRVLKAVEVKRKEGRNGRIELLFSVATDTEDTYSLVGKPFMKRKVELEELYAPIRLIIQPKDVKYFQ